MDRIVFFNINQENSNKFKELRFSYQRAHNVSFVSSIKQLETLNLTEEFLLFYFAKDITDNKKIELLQIRKTWQMSYICLCSLSESALIAWKLNVQDFLDFPISMKRIISSYQKFISENSNLPSELALKTSEGLIKVPYRNINYIKASGNYSFIYRDNGSKIMQTKQIGKFIHLVENSQYFERVHRSLILNLEKVSAIKNNTLVFYKGDTTLPISKSLASRVKSLLLRE